MLIICHNQVNQLNRGTWEVASSLVSDIITLNEKTS